MLICTILHFPLPSSPLPEMYEPVNELASAFAIARCNQILLIVIGQAEPATILSNGWQGKKKQMDDVYPNSKCQVGWSSGRYGVAHSGARLVTHAPALLSIAVLRVYERRILLTHGSPAKTDSGLGFPRERRRERKKKEEEGNGKRVARVV